MLEAFDTRGGVRLDVSESEILTLNPEQRDAFTSLLSAALEEKDAEEEFAAATANLRDCNRAADLALNKHRAAHPPISFNDARKAVIARPRN